MTEALTQSAVRLEAARRGFHLFRNNVGVLVDIKGRPVRFGLANDSAAVNRAVKSADLIGWEPVVITPDMVGQTIARFLSVECKPAGWRFDPRDEHELAQAAWAQLVINAGGRALFATGPESL
jgi:hypothetical protein